MGFRLTGLTDVGAYLTDREFKGIYGDQQVHEPDVRRVLSRAWDHGLERIVIIATTLKSSRKALKLSCSDKRLWSTAGCHPKQIQQFAKDPDEYSEQISNLVEKNKKVAALGDCGLDYRPEVMERSNKKDQLKYFDWQVQLSLYHKKPLLLHYRHAFEDMMRILNKYNKPRGLVHMFTGTAPEANELVRKGFYIGVSGCTLDTKERLEVLKSVPLNRLVLGSQAPFCSIDRCHAAFKHCQTKFFPARAKPGVQADGMVLGRTEPCSVVHVLETVAAVKKLEPQELADIVRANVEQCFFKKPKKESTSDFMI